MTGFLGFYKRQGSEYSNVYIWQPDPILNMTSDEQYNWNKERFPDFTAMKTSKPRFMAQKVA